MYPQIASPPPVFLHTLSEKMLRAVRGARTLLRAASARVAGPSTRLSLDPGATVLARSPAALLLPSRGLASEASPPAVEPVLQHDLSPFLELFVDPYEVDPDLPPPGRRWSAAEIRLKSDADLQKLWVVLMRERNMLYSVKMLHDKRKTSMPHPDRLHKARKGMTMIKRVLGERDRQADGARERGEISNRKTRRQVLQDNKRAEEAEAEAEAALAGGESGRAEGEFGEAVGGTAEAPIDKRS